MKKIVLTILILVTVLLAFSQQRWEVIISDDNTNLAPFHTTSCYDGGQLIDISTDWEEGIMIKIDVNGEELWRKTQIFDKINLPNGIKQNAVGETMVYSNATIRLYNPCGELLWCNRFVNQGNYDEISFNDAIFMQNGDIVALTWLRKDNAIYDVGLTAFDINGNMLWFHDFNLYEKYQPLLGKPTLPISIAQYEDFLLISGDCYYANPDNPNLVILRPMFIKTTEDFDEDWFLPFGVNDTIIGTAFGTAFFDGNIFQGYGDYYKPNSNIINSILMYFDINGNVTGKLGIDNSVFGSDVELNSISKVLNINDTLQIMAGSIGNKGEWIMDRQGNVYEYQNHTGTKLGFKTLNTSNNVNFNVSYNTTDYDIILYKFNNDLSHTPIDTNTYEYDYLFDDLPIPSDTIYIENCSIITDINEVPTPKEYYTALKTIPINIFPNPASSGITFEFGNTDFHVEIVLNVLNINGDVVFTQALDVGQTKINTSVSTWSGGMYIATASSRIGGTGSAKFVVRK